MAERRPRILQVNLLDVSGGAEKVAWNLFAAYRTRGYRSWLAVGRRRADDPDVYYIMHHDAGGAWRRLRERRRVDMVGGSWRMRGTTVTRCGRTRTGPCGCDGPRPWRNSALVASQGPWETSHGATVA